MTNVVLFNLANFRTQFVAFSNSTAYPDATLNMYFATASLYIQNNGGWSFFTTAQLTQALNLMVAHLALLGTQAANGNVATVMSGGTVDKVSVTLEPPPVKNQFQWWLNATPYGAQLLAMLEMLAVGGFYTSTGLPGRAGFRFSGIC